MNKKIYTIGTVCILAALCLAGASYAYLMDTDTNETLFTVGDVSGTLSVASDIESTAEVLPGEDVLAQPSITLDEGSEDAIAFLEVELPVDENADIYTAFGEKSSSNQLVVNGTIQSDWTLLTDAESKKETADNEVRVFAYTKPLTADSPTTGPAFNYLRVANFVDSDALNNKEVVITGALIQRKGLGVDDEDTIDVEDLEKIYNRLNSQL